MINTHNDLPRDEDRALREEDLNKEEETSSDLQDKEIGEPELDESDMEENELSDDDDDIEWEVPGDTNSESATRS